MRKLKLLVGVVFGGILAVTLYAAPAQAQATRTWVSGVGDDANPCSRTAPCKTFAGAISKTATRGEINVLDPGGFGGVTITKSITIRSDHVQAGILVSGTNGIIINMTSPAATDKVVLEGLDFDGIGSGLNGVNILNSQTTLIRRCAIRNFAQSGILLQTPAGQRVVVEDSQIYNNAVAGITVSGSGNAIVDTVKLDKNGPTQISMSGGVLVLSNSFLAGSASNMTLSGGAQVISYGNNILRGASGFPTSTLQLQ